MKTLLTSALFVTLVLIVVGAVCTALVAPLWVCGLYGVAGCVGVWSVVDCLALVWTVSK